MSDDEAEPIRPKKKARKRRRGDDPETGAAREAPFEAAERVAPREAGEAGAHTGEDFEDARAASLRWPLLGAASAAVLGLALVGTGPSEAGMWVCVAGGVGLIAAIHRLGRLGAA